MNFYQNLPPQQRRLQQLVDQFNADERLWEKLEPRRKLRRILFRCLSKRKLEKLDLLEFSRARPLTDCVGAPFDQ